MNAPRPLIIVAGLGRCGSSLVMQMLATAGIRTAGSFPDFEEPALNAPRVDRATLAGLDDAAVKILDPHRCGPIFEGLNAVVIWLDRDEREQAASMIKMARYAKTGELPPRASRRELRSMGAIIRRDRAKGAQVLRCLPMVTLRYEKLIQKPAETAAEMAGFLDLLGYEVDAGRMAACVLKSSATCSPDFRMEASLIAAANRAEKSC